MTQNYSTGTELNRFGAPGESEGDEEMLKNAFAVIMAGGRGERFWPLSTSKRPKQVLSLIGGKPMIAIAVDRLDGLVPADRVIVVTNRDLVTATAAALPNVPVQNIVGEPVGRDTAAAVALASALVRKRAADGVFCILTADHIIEDIAVFQRTIRAGLEMALRKDVLITIGITPTFASTGYGYIEEGELEEEVDGVKLCRAKRFVEKPDATRAGEYLRAGNYCWNSGMFMWSVDSIQAALKQHTPNLFEMARRIEQHVDTDSFASALEKEYEVLKKISVDYAIMEKSNNILMARGAFAWDDVGSWVALENHFEKDQAGNVMIGSCEQLDSTGNIVVSDGRLTALLGVHDMVVVQAEGATLVCPKNMAQDVKKLVALLREKGSHQELL